MLLLLAAPALAFEGVRSEALWRYYDAGALSGSPAWYDPLYDDSTWSEGEAPLGFAASQTTTVNNHGGITWYFRTRFDVADASSVTDGILDLIVDDGAVVYLNGIELGRWNMPGGVIIDSTPASTSTAGPHLYAAQAVVAGALVDGENLLAVEVHQRSVASSDIFLDLGLSWAPHLLAGPWIVQAGPDEVTIAWESYVADAGVVQWGPTAAYTNAASDVVSDTLHFVTLTGLTAGTDYHYAVEADGEQSVDFTFRTPADPGASDLLVAFYGDSRTHPDIHGMLADLVAGVDPDLVLHSGDFVDDPETSPDWYNQVFDPAAVYLSDTPFFPVPGNHESEFVYPATPYWDYFPAPGATSWWSTAVGPIRFVFLDSNDPDYADGDPTDSAQWAWLDAELAAATEPYIVAVQHHPVYTSGWHATDASVEGFETYLGPLLESYGVTAFIAGHDHRYERSYRSGTHYLTVGGGGSDFQGPCTDAAPPDTCINPYSEFAVTSYCWATLSLSGGTLSFDVYDETGAPLEPTVVLGGATNAAPAASLTGPDGLCDTADTSVSVTATVTDPDDTAGLTFGVDTDGAGCDGTTLLTGLTESDTTSTWTLDTTGLAAGEWFVYALVDDGVNTTCAYSDGTVRVAHPTTAGTVLVPLGSTWSYSAAGVIPSATWFRPSYNVTAWATGCGELGYGDGDEDTLLTTAVNTAYFRSTFTFSGPLPSSLWVEAAIDDGAAFYLNGREVKRVRMPAGAVSYATAASANGEGYPLTVAPLNATAPGFLVNGTNTLAVEVHQRSAASSDLSFDLRLIGVP